MLLGKTRPTAASLARPLPVDKKTAGLADPGIKPRRELKVPDENGDCGKLRKPTDTVSCSRTLKSSVRLNSLHWPVAELVKVRLGFFLTNPATNSRNRKAAGTIKCLAFRFLFLIRRFQLSRHRDRRSRNGTGSWSGRRRNCSACRRNSSASGRLTGGCRFHAGQLTREWIRRRLREILRRVLQVARRRQRHAGGPGLASGQDRKRRHKAHQESMTQASQSLHHVPHP
jgi:hypothetical protein